MKNSKCIIAVTLLLSILLSLFSVFASFAEGDGEDEPSEVTVVSQGYESVSTNSVLTKAYTASGTLISGTPSVVEGAGTYTEGLVADFDYSKI